MIKRITLIVGAALLTATLALAQDRDKDAATGPAAPAAASKAKLGADDLFFTEPYAYLDRPPAELIGMWLPLDYAAIKYPNGFADTVNTKEPLIKYKTYSPITAKDQLDRVIKQSGFKVGDAVTVLSAAGRAYPAQVAGFSYLGNSPSTVLVMADLKVSGNPDPTVANAHGIAVRGKRDLAPTKIFSRDPLPSSDPLQAKLLAACAGGVAGSVHENVNVAPALLTEAGPEVFFVSFWTHPEANYEIDDVKLTGCALKPAGGAYSRVELPLPIKLLQVYDLDQDGQAELFGAAGDGAEVCYVYLVPTASGYQLLRKGMCAGY
jgi:hypothetical protein